MGEHLPCKQGVESSNLLVSSEVRGNFHFKEKEPKELLGTFRLYLENRILNQNILIFLRKKEEEERETFVKPFTD